MGFSHSHGVSVRAVAAAVPSNIERTKDLHQFSDETIKQVIHRLGVEERRKCISGQTQLDLCEQAAKKCISELEWSEKDINILIFVTQTPDHIMPSNSSLLHGILNLGSNTECFDINLGCSGFAYALSVASRMLQACGCQDRALICLGDASSISSAQDPSTYPLMGDAGACVALEYSETNTSEMRFSLGTVGNYFNAIKVEDGGARNPVSVDSLKVYEDECGAKRTRLHAKMKGDQILRFSLSNIPDRVSDFLMHFSLDQNTFEYVVLHQPNRLIYNALAKKLSVSEEKLLDSLRNFGNTSSASIPLNLVSNLAVKSDANFSGELLCCGFGSGLSFGIASIMCEKLKVCVLIEVE